MSSPTLDHDRLKSNLEAVQSRIASACDRSGRPAGAAKLVAVTKMVPADWALALVTLGQYELGENYPQELWRKVEVVPSPPAHWHLIGHLQSNKAKKTYPLVSRCVQRTGHGAYHSGGRLFASELLGRGLQARLVT